MKSLVSPRQLPSLLLCAAVLAPTASAQSNFTPPAVRRGMVSTIQSGITLNTAGTTTTFLRRKPAGDQVTAPVVVSPFGPQGAASALPDYGELAYLAPGIQFDAHSTGNGAFPGVDAAGWLQLDNRWFALSASVSNTTKGVPGSQIAESEMSTGNPGAEIVSYYFEQSPVLDPTLVGQTLLEFGREDLGFAAGSTDDVGALDYALAFFIEGPRTAAFFTHQTTYFFSVTKAWADTQVGVMFAADMAGDPNVAVHEAHGADVYRVDWTGSSWTLPKLYVPYEHLAFKSSGDMDALEVNIGQGRIVYSATRSSGLDLAKTRTGEESQVMFFEHGSDHSSTVPTGTDRPVVLKDGAGNTVAKKIGVDDAVNGEEIDSLCGIEPEESNLAFQTDFGVATEHVAALGSPMGLSVARSSDLAGPVQSLPGSTPQPDRFEVQVTGWGDKAPALVLVRLYTKTTALGVAADPSDLSTWMLAGTELRLAGENTTRFFVDNLLPVGVNRDEISFYATAENRFGVVLGSWMSTMEY